MTTCIRHQGSDSPTALMSSVRPLPRASGYNVSSKAGRGEAGISNGQLCWHSVSSAHRGGCGSLLSCLRLLSCRTWAPRALPSSPGAPSQVSLCWAPPHPCSCPHPTGRPGPRLVLMEASTSSPGCPSIPQLPLGASSLPLPRPLSAGLFHWPEVSRSSVHRQFQEPVISNHRPGSSRTCE